MTEHEWLEGTQPRRMISGLRTHSGRVRPSQRQLRLIACAISRHIFAQRMGLEIKTAIEVAESFADSGNEAEVPAVSASPAVRLPRLVYAYLNENSSFVSVMSIDFGLQELMKELDFDKGWQERLKEGVEQSRLVRDVLCNPFRPVSCDSRWLATNVVALARTVYEETSFDKLPFLADALEEAGCTNADLLAHCRELGPHVKGCWAVDLLLGKK